MCIGHIHRKVAGMPVILILYSMELAYTVEHGYNEQPRAKEIVLYIRSSLYQETRMFTFFLDTPQPPFNFLHTGIFFLIATLSFSTILKDWFSALGVKTPQNKQTRVTWAKKLGQVGRFSIFFFGSLPYSRSAQLYCLATQAHTHTRRHDVQINLFGVFNRRRGGVRVGWGLGE